jgi:hypothetical protein
MSYPRWRYFPSYAAPPDWVEPLASIFEESRPQIDSVVHSKRMESNDVLRVLAKGLIGMGFEVEPPSAAEARAGDRRTIVGAGGLRRTRSQGRRRDERPPSGRGLRPRPQGTVCHERR